MTERDHTDERERKDHLVQNELAEIVTRPEDVEREPDEDVDRRLCGRGRQKRANDGWRLCISRRQPGVNRYHGQLQPNPTTMKA